jgi:hypothetical protein
MILVIIHDACIYDTDESLLSVSQMMDTGISVSFSDGICNIITTYHNIIILSMKKTPSSASSLLTNCSLYSARPLRVPYTPV